MYQAKHPQNPTLFFKESLSEFIPSPIKQKYEQLKNEYIDYLMQK